MGRRRGRDLPDLRGLTFNKSVNKAKTTRYKAKALSGKVKDSGVNPFFLGGGVAKIYLKVIDMGSLTHSFQDRIPHVQNTTERPAYLSELLQFCTTPRLLRSSDHRLLHDAAAKTVFGIRAFCHAAPSAWMELAVAAASTDR